MYKSRSPYSLLQPWHWPPSPPPHPSGYSIPQTHSLTLAMVLPWYRGEGPDDP